MTLNRRTVLTIGVGSALALAGCLEGSIDPQDDGDTNGGNEDTDTNGDNDTTDADDNTTDGTDDNTGDADSVPILTGYELSESVVTPTAERFSDLDSWGLFFATRETALDTFSEDIDQEGIEDVREFIDVTDYDNGERILYVHAYAPETCYELVLDTDPYVASNGIPVVETLVDRTAPDTDPCGEAVTPVRILMRLSFDLEGGTPDVVEVHVTGHRDEPEEFLVEAEG